jgi:hypothetical protein
MCFSQSGVRGQGKPQFRWLCVCLSADTRSHFCLALRTSRCWLRRDDAPPTESRLMPIKSRNALMDAAYDDDIHVADRTIDRGSTGALAALEKFLIGRTMIAIDRDARVLKKFVEPAANCAPYTTD